MPLLSVVTERQDEMKKDAPPPGDPKALPPPESLTDRLRPYLAELLGTFALTLVAAGGEVIAHVSGGEVSHAARAVAPGMLVLALIYAIGDASGAHFNPPSRSPSPPGGTSPGPASPATGPFSLWGQSVRQACSVPSSGTLLGWVRASRTTASGRLWSWKPSLPAC